MALDFDEIFILTEFVYTILVVVLCFAIYFRTKEIYELTKYKGIKYFRSAFLFFGLSFIIRFFLSLFMFSREFLDIIIRRGPPSPIYILLLGYLSTVAIVYLIYSSLWKKFSSNVFLIAGHALALFLAFVSFATRSHFILLYMQSVLLIIALVLSFVMHKEKKISQIQVLYVLVFISWIMNLTAVGPRRVFGFGIIPLMIGLVPQLVSLVIFFMIYHKVSKWAK